MSSEFLFDQYEQAFPDLHAARQNHPEYDLSQHFREHGKFEGRHLVDDTKGYIDGGLVSTSGYVLLNGWVLDPFRFHADGSAQEYTLRVETGFHSFRCPPGAMVRYRRNDINEAFKVPGDQEFGFVCFFSLGDVPRSNRLKLFLETEAGSTCLVLDCELTPCQDAPLIARYFAHFRHLAEGASGLAACLQAYDGHGSAVIDCWQKHLESAKRHQVIEFGTEAADQADFSAITVLYGSTELLRLQYMLFFKEMAKIGGHVVIASNSPEIHKQVVDITQYAHQLYGLPVTLVLLQGNVGFSAANNVAAQYAKGGRIALVNPDIFALDLTDWQRFRTAMLELGPEEFVGPLLHYSDGSVMHAGMSIHKDPIFLAGPRPAERQYDYMLRVDHPKKGQGLEFFDFPERRFEMPALTGGFLMAQQGFFERVGGLTERIVFGHFEDADMCLRAHEMGGRILVDSGLSFVHLEGKGSTSGDPNAAGGSTLFNRCHFTRTHQAGWADKGIG